MVSRAELDELSIVFFDGVCGLCNRTVDFLIEKDVHQRLRYAPLQGEVAQFRLSDAERSLDSIVFRSNGYVWKRSSAIVRILWKIGGIWSLAGSLLWLIPKPLRDVGYSLVAKYRYRMFGKQETCRMPTEADRELILE